jgi:DNA repair exonuclease SbcCD nuclease subunit
MDLIIGDLHCKSDNLEDTDKIFDLILDSGKKTPLSRIIFLGDIFHNHNAVNLTVADFVKKQFARLVELNTQIIVLAGNHDGHSPKSVEINAVDVILDQFAHVVSKGYYADETYVYMPFYGDGEEFIAQMKQAFKKHGDKILVCHQSFIGGVYENGHPISDGVYPSNVPFSIVINGHIHKKQYIAGNIACLGTPRAISTNEANDPKIGRAHV